MAESVAAAAVAAFSAAGIPAATGAGTLLLARAAEDSLWSAGEEVEVDENGNIIGMSIS